MRILILIAGLVMCFVISSCKPNVNEGYQRKSNLAAEQKEREELGAKRREAERVAREKARELEEAEEKKRQEERKAKELERERQRKEMLEKAEAEQQNKERYSNVITDFRSATCLFASDDKANTGKFDKDGIVYLVREDYLSAKNFYKLECKDKKIIKAHRINEREGMLELSESELKELSDCNRCIVLRENSVAEIWGTGSRVRSLESLKGDSILPSELELAKLSDVALELGMQQPKCKYRISLKHIKTAKLIQVGIIEFGEKIRASLIDKMIEEKIQERRAANNGLKPPKLKPFKPTVVLYDGDMIRKEIGVTKVPRNFRHIGTSRNKAYETRTVRDNRDRWQALYDEALRQERKAREVAQENMRIKDEYDSKVRNFMNSTITQEERKAELSNYKILIERSRTKVICQ